MRSEEGEHGADTAPYEVVASQDGADIYGICISLVIEDGIEEQDRAHWKE